MAARAIGSGTISFGLVSIPVKLYTATSAKSIGFNMLHEKCGGRMKQQYFCPIDNEVVERGAIIKGFEFQKDQYVKFTDEELKKLESPRTDELELVEFVPQSSVDLVYLEKTYYLGPDKGGDRAYRLLSEAMERTQKIAVGRYWARGKEQLVLVRPYKKGLILHQVYYSDEVRSFDDVETAGDFAFKDIEKDLADKLIAQLHNDKFQPEKYKDEYATRVMAAIEQKAAGTEVTNAPEAPKAQIIDLLEALKRSVTEARDQQAANTQVADAAPAPAAAAAEAEPTKAKAKGPKKAGPKADVAATEEKKKSTA